MRKREYGVRNGKKRRLYKGRLMLKTKRHFRVNKSSIAGGSRLSRRRR